ncbi:MAG TPA: S46 family peptidase [Candidatus Acidoferrales bacterium]|nr:S46 family peptidase [Candidatus Acidoferrales bacterium]
MKRIRTTVLFLGVALLSSSLPAEEGMWMPQQMPELAARLKALGFTGDAKTFADLTGQPMGAVVSLGGCTASFVSPDGLIVTNHHCVTGGLQFNSTPQRNLLKDGYLAKNRDEELPNGPGSRVFVTTSVVEVTASITGGIDAKATDRERYDLIDRRVKERIATCEKSGQRCNVASFFDGLKYFEIAQMEIKDVRLVYAPAEGIGVFGGETDNWRWPRHTGDWSFLRAYVGRDGKPAVYSKDNVPFKPKHWLKVSTTGIKPGELVFVTGYPGRTQRHQTYSEVKETTEYTMPLAIRRAREQLVILDQLTKQNPAIALKVAGRVQGLNNGLTNQLGMLEGLTKGGSLDRKQQQEKELESWIAADPARQKKYGDVLPALRALQAESEKTRERNSMLATLSMASGYLGAAQTLYRLSVERAKPDMEREAGFQQRDWPRLRDAQDRLQRTLDVTVDRALLHWAMFLASALNPDQRIVALDEAAGLRAAMPAAESGKAIDAYLQTLFAGTKLGDREFRLGLMEKSTADLVATKDPFILLAAALDPLVEANREAMKSRAGARSRLAPRYMEAMLAKAGGLVAPDANSTLRVTYGQVKGVDAKDGLFYKPQTTLAGIVQKQTGDGDFNAPQVQLDAIKALRAGKKTSYLDKALGDVPVNFLSTVDTTGGNSGSPTLNAKGELVGLLFDGTYESVASNYVFDTVSTRSIHVDVRYMLWNMADVDGAGHLLEEMGIAPVRSAGVR